MAELKATLKQALSKNKYVQKKGMWEQRAVEDKPDENFAMSLKNADGELLGVIPKLPETAKVTSNDNNKYETERLKRASEKEDALLNKYCDGKDNAWRPDSYFEETLGERNVPWPMRPTDFYNNPNLVSRVVMAFEESRRIQKDKKKKEEKAAKKKEKKDKKSKKKKDKKEKKNKKEKNKKKEKEREKEKEEKKEKKEKEKEKAKMKEKTKEREKHKEKEREREREKEKEKTRSKEKVKEKEKTKEAKQKKSRARSSSEALRKKRSRGRSTRQPKRKAEKSPEPRRHRSPSRRRSRSRRARTPGKARSRSRRRSRSRKRSRSGKRRGSRSRSRRRSRSRSGKKRDKSRRRRSADARSKSPKRKASAKDAGAELASTEELARFPPLSRVRLHGLMKNVDLNGLCGYIVPPGCSQSQSLPGALQVRLETSREVCVRPSNLDLLDGNITDHELSAAKVAALEKVLATLQNEAAQALLVKMAQA
mmetsp:Transcript_48326/g.113100  ORF Transcript_48326/g.113100 Transcript_48326/m.113100 type:complete len:480 (-) Transcript_48326:52-1491(-)